jgi:hypothetical protein
MILWIIRTLPMASWRVVLPNYINVSYDHLILSRGKWQTRSRRAAMIAPSPRAKPPTRRRSTLSSMENWTFIRLRTSARVLTWSTRRPGVCNRLGQMTCSLTRKDHTYSDERIGLDCRLVLVDIGTTHHDTDKKSAASKKPLSLDLDLASSFTSRRDDDSGRGCCGANIEETLSAGDEEGYGLAGSRLGITKACISVSAIRIRYMYK